MPGRRSLAHQQGKGCRSFEALYVQGLPRKPTRSTMICFVGNFGMGCLILRIQNQGFLKHVPTLAIIWSVVVGPMMGKSILKVHFSTGYCWVRFGTVP